MLSKNRKKIKKNSVKNSEKCQKLKKFEKILVPSIFRDTWDSTVITLNIRVNQMPVSVIRDNDAIFSFFEFFLSLYDPILTPVDPVWPPAANQLTPVSICLIFMNRTRIIPVKSVRSFRMTHPNLIKWISPTTLKNEIFLTKGLNLTHYP